MEEALLEKTVTWAASTDRDSRLFFIKNLLKCCNYEELQVVQRLVDNAKKRKTPNLHFVQEKKRKKKEGAGEDAQTSASAAQTSSEPAPLPSFWWEKLEKKNIVSVDTEMVTPTKLNQYGKHEMVAATVAIVGWNGEVLMNETVYHKEGSYLVNEYTDKITGFKGKMLECGIPLEKVKEKVAAILDGKLVVSYAGGGDFLALSLCPSDFNHFDMQFFFRKFNGQRTRSGEKVYQPINLRSLYYHYFSKDIQEGKHSAVIDAQCTMEVFQKVYCRLAKENNFVNRNSKMDGEFDNIKKMK